MISPHGQSTVTATADLLLQRSANCGIPRKSPPFQYKPKTYTLEEFKKIFVNGTSSGDL